MSSLEKAQKRVDSLTAKAVNLQKQKQEYEAKQIMEAVERYSVDKIYIAIPSATAAQRGEILNICKESGCELKNLPGMYQFMRGEITVSKIREELTKKKLSP